MPYVQAKINVIQFSSDQATNPSCQDFKQPSLFNIWPNHRGTSSATGIIIFHVLAKICPKGKRKGRKVQKKVRRVTFDTRSNWPIPSADKMANSSEIGKDEYEHYKMWKVTSSKRQIPDQKCSTKGNKIFLFRL
jgi:hypothetical protein